MAGRVLVLVGIPEDTQNIPINKNASGPQVKLLSATMFVDLISGYKEVVSFSLMNTSEEISLGANIQTDTILILGLVAAV